MTPRPAPTATTLSVPSGAHAASRAWHSTAVEVEAARGLLATTHTRGLAPEAATSVARLLTGWERAAADLCADAEEHARAVDAALRDLDAADRDAAGRFSRLATLADGLGPGAGGGPRGDAP